MKSIIAENVRNIINQKGLKQRAVAMKAGYSLQTFNNMLNGRKIVSDVDVANIAIALNVPVSLLFEEKTEEKELQEV